MVSVAIDVSVAGGIAGAFANVGRLREIDAGYAYGLLGAAYFPILVVLLLVDHLLGHPRKLLITFFVVMTVGYNALTGNRTTILATFLSCLIVYVYIRGIKKPWRFAALSTAIGLVVFSALVFWAFTRSYNISISDIPRIVNIMRDEDSVTFYSQIIGEFSAVDSFAAILHGGPSVFPFRYGETYLDVALFVVPRAVWPNKPKSFGRAVGDYVTENGNDVPPGEVAELYINWHVFGIVIGMFFLGWLMDLIYCRAVGGSAGTLAMYGLLIPYVGALLSHDAVDGLVILLTVVLPMWPAVLYIEAVKSREFIAT
jgi:oligosaccharide repeat unit polymerase